MNLAQRIKASIRSLLFMYKTEAPIYVIYKFLICKISAPHVRHIYNSYLVDFEKNHKNNLNITHDWFSVNIPYWLWVIDKSDLRNKNSVKCLEIGSWEGLSAYFILNTLQNSELTCVDTWEGADEHKSGSTTFTEALSEIESKFDKNLLSFGDRVNKYKGTSFSFFNSLDVIERYDLIYIDGSHFVDDVIIDAVKCFQMLKNGGIMILDDYLWRYYRNPIENPAGAVNMFLRIKKNRIKLIRIYSQVIIQKIGP